MAELTNLPEWQALVTHQQEVSKFHLRELFYADSQRFELFSLEAADLFLDYSKNCITAKTIELLCNLATASNLTLAIDAMFKGKTVNITENRPALHVALRNFNSPSLWVNTQNISSDIQIVLSKMAVFTEQVRSGNWRGYTDKPITDVVNVGIGGSDLGPAMVTEALTSYAMPALNLHFVSNIDGSYLQQTLEKLNPETTLVIISSKSFTTQETLTNAQSIRAWFRQQSGDNKNESLHFVAVTSNIAAAQSFGIVPNNIFPIWEWVGGRYSLWSAVGLPIALAVGMENFHELLAGAAKMDQHFCTAPLQQNMPVLLGLLSIWYNNFFAAPAQAILPYDQALRRLPAYLQQAEMESNGKSTTNKDLAVGYTTSPIIFGEPGTNAQHTFYQLLHQGTHLIPVDFIIPLQPHCLLGDHHAILFAHALSQSKAMMEGKTALEIIQEMRADGHDDEEIKRLTPHKILPGNRPSNTLLFSKLTPRNLGALLALYEHKIFVQSVIWQINPFDQWGVEYGKQLAHSILANVLNCNHISAHDGSTNGLIAKYHQLKKTRNE